MRILDSAILIIAVEEGYEAEVYIDSRGFPTVGVGLKIGYKGQPLEEFREFPAMPREVADIWTKDHVLALIDQMQYYPQLQQAYGYCSTTRKAVILSMCYQLGLKGAAMFENTWTAVASGDYDTAAFEMKDSRWYRQTTHRVERHATMMINGTILPFYGE